MLKNAKPVQGQQGSVNKCISLLVFLYQTVGLQTEFW